MKKSLIISIIIILSGLSCTKKEEVAIFIEGGPYVAYDYSPLTDSLWLCDSRLIIEINTDPKFDTLLVLLNNDTFNVYYDNYKLEINDTLPVFSQYNLKIESNVGTASASCDMPEPFKIINPHQPIQAGEDCDLIWHRSNNAQWYSIFLAIFDNYGGSSYKTITTSDTTVTVEGSFFSPLSSYVEIFISAVNGIEFSDDNGNIKGNGIGYWLGKLSVHETINIE